MAPEPRSRLPDLPAARGKVPPAIHAEHDEDDAMSRRGRWAEPPERSVAVTLRWKADPAPSLKALQAATKGATKAAKAALPAAGSLEVAGDVKPGKPAGAMTIIIRLRVRGPGMSSHSAQGPAAAFVAAFEKAMPAPMGLRRTGA